MLPNFAPYYNDRRSHLSTYIIVVYYYYIATHTVQYYALLKRVHYNIIHIIRKTYFVLHSDTYFGIYFFAAYQTLRLPPSTYNGITIQKLYYYLDGNHSNRGHVLRFIPA